MHLIISTTSFSSIAAHTNRLSSYNLQCNLHFSFSNCTFSLFLCNFSKKNTSLLLLLKVFEIGTVSGKQTMVSERFYVQNVTSFWTTNEPPRTTGKVLNCTRHKKVQPVSLTGLKKTLTKLVKWLNWSLLSGKCLITYIWTPYDDQTPTAWWQTWYATTHIFQLQLIRSKKLHPKALWQLRYF